MDFATMRCHVRLVRSLPLLPPGNLVPSLVPLHLPHAQVLRARGIQVRCPLTATTVTSVCVTHEERTLPRAPLTPVV